MLYKCERERDWEGELVCVWEGAIERESEVEKESKGQEKDFSHAIFPSTNSNQLDVINVGE